MGRFDPIYDSRIWRMIVEQRKILDGSALLRWMKRGRLIFTGHIKNQPVPFFPGTHSEFTSFEKRGTGKRWTYC
jgi:hypothetical protein